MALSAHSFQATCARFYVPAALPLADPLHDVCAALLWSCSLRPRPRPRWVVKYALSMNCVHTYALVCVLPSSPAVDLKTPILFSSFCLPNIHLTAHRAKPFHPGAQRRPILCFHVPPSQSEIPQVRWVFFLVIMGYYLHQSEGTRCSCVLAAAISTADCPTPHPHPSLTDV